MGGSQLLPPRKTNDAYSAIEMYKAVRGRRKFGRAKWTNLGQDCRAAYCTAMGAPGSSMGSTRLVVVKSSANRERTSFGLLSSDFVYTVFQGGIQPPDRTSVC